MDSIERISDLERRYVSEVLDTGFRSSAGHLMCSRLEAAFAKQTGVTNAISFVNGTATMQAFLLAAGVGPGDEVIVPPLTMASPALAVLQVGATPVFADIDGDTLQIHPASVEAAITDRTKGVIAVALYGLPPDLNALRAITSGGLFLLEDDAQAHGATYDGRPIGQVGDAASFSLQSSKHVTSGEGGVVVTNDADLALRIRRLNSLGYSTIGAEEGRIDKDAIQDPDFPRHVSLGFNLRMPELCAAVALAQVERIDTLVGRRIDAAGAMADAIAGCEWLTPQSVPDDRTHSYWTFALQLDNPDVSWHEFRRALLECGGDPFYGAWRVNYLEPLFEDLGYRAGLCPTAEAVQPRLAQLKTNYWDWSDAERQAQALADTVARFA